MNEVDIALIAQMALKVLSIRFLTLVSVLCSMGLFCWAMYNPTWERVVGATLGGIVFWCLVNLKGKGNET
jgi:hypothetical protein